MLFCGLFPVPYGCLFSIFFWGGVVSDLRHFWPGLLKLVFPLLQFNVMLFVPISDVFWVKTIKKGRQVKASVFAKLCRRGVRR